MCRSPMRRSALALVLALSFAPLGAGAAAGTAPALPRADPEPPNAQARAVAALGNARVIALAPEPPKTIAGIGGDVGGQPTTIAGGAKDLEAAMSDLHA